MTGVALVDISELRSTGKVTALLKDQLLRSAASCGFVKVTGHGIADEEIDRLFGWGRDFFAWPDIVKRGVTRSARGPYRGYAAVGQEQIAAITGYIKGDAVGGAAADVKECFDLGPTSDTIYPTPWPHDHPQGEEFKRFMQAFFEKCLGIHRQLLAAFEQVLDLKDGELRQRCTAGNGEVRLTHYPPVTVRQLVPGRCYRIAEHTDVGVLTLLFQDSVGGLEIEDPANPATFVPVESARPSEMIVNIADTLQHWTAGALKSTNHRVLAPQGSAADQTLPARYSVGFFGKADADASMAVVPSLAADTVLGHVDEAHCNAQEYYNFMHERTSAALQTVKA